MMWKPFKAVAQQRKKRLQLKIDKKMLDFMRNMVLADELFLLCMGEIDNDVVDQIFATLSLPLVFMQFAGGKYDHEKHKKPLSQQHMAMEETWRMLLISHKTALQEREARREATRLTKKHRAVDALCRHKMRKCINNMTVY